MRRKSMHAILCLLLCLAMGLFLFGCGEKKSGSTIEEPEITGEYLQGEYAQQLLTDGAETVLGYVTVTKQDSGDYSVDIAERQVVASDENEDGYYIADNNVTKEATLGEEGRFACLDGDELVVVSADDFVKKYNDGDKQLYTIYLMGDYAELIIATNPEDVETK